MKITVRELRSAIGQAIREVSVKDIRYKKTNQRLRDDGALAKLVRNVHNLAETYDCKFEDVLDTMLEMKELYSNDNED